MNPAAMAAKASKKFSQYGQEMSFVQETVSAQPDPLTGLPKIERVSTPFKGMWDTVKTQETGTLIQAGDAVIWAGGDAIPVPSIADWIQVEQTAWDIVDIQVTKPGAVPICYKLYVREAGDAETHIRNGGVE